MDAICFVLICLLLLYLRPILDEAWTILQIIKSVFSKNKCLKEYGSWAIVTGCTDGIGKSYSFELAQRGLNIVLISRNLEKLDKVASEIKSKCNVETKIIVADFSKGRDIYEKIREGINELDVGILVNNVGIQYPYPMYFGELPEDDMWNVLNVNLGSLVQMTRMVLPKMVDKNRGAIVNLSSGSKLQPLPFMNLYAASKIFIDFYTEALRHEYRSKNITIQSLCPFYISTKINCFNDDLMRENLFIPTADTYAKHAVSTLGLIDNTTGYWPHRLQYIFFIISPVWIKTYFGGLMYKLMRWKHLRKLEETKKS